HLPDRRAADTTGPDSMSERHFRILIVDDEPNIRTGLARALQAEADEIGVAGDGGEALALFRRHHHDLVITDLKMPGPLSALHVAPQPTRAGPAPLRRVTPARGSAEPAVEARGRGAHAYTGTPLALPLLRLQVRTAYERHRLADENRRLRERLAAVGEFPEMV